MNRIIKNSFFGLVFQLTSALSQFIIRNLIIKYIGVELLGISSTFNSVLGALSLADLGFQTAIVYRLYKPIHDDDKKKIAELLYIFKYIYIGVGCFFLVACTFAIFFIPFIIKGVEINRTVYEIFVLSSLSPAMTYFLSYKRSLLYADQKEYISKIVDCACLITFTLAKIYAIAINKNFQMYLIFDITQIMVSNIIVHFYCKFKYPYLQRNKSFNKETFKIIMTDTKDVFTGKLSGYIYSSTDNIVISSFISTITVGYFVNYTMITKQISSMINSILNPVAPFVGRMLAKNEEKASQNSFFEIYTFIRFIIAILVVVPTVVLLDDFVDMWIGKEYLLSWKIPILLGTDIFISIVYAACYDFNNGSGLFKLEKKVMFIGALMNITISIVLTNVLGIEGVLIGTVFTQFYFWISRSKIAIKYSLKENNKYYINYLKKCMFYVITFYGLIFGGSKAELIVTLDNKFLCFIVKGVLLEFINGIVLLLLFKNNANVKKIKDLIMKYR